MNRLKTASSLSRYKSVASLIFRSRTILRTVRHSECCIARRGRDVIVTAVTSSSRDHPAVVSTSSAPSRCLYRHIPVVVVWTVYTDRCPDCARSSPPANSGRFRRHVFPVCDFGFSPPSLLLHVYINNELINLFIYLLTYLLTHSLIYLFIITIVHTVIVAHTVN